MLDGKAVFGLSWERVKAKLRDRSVADLWPSMTISPTLKYEFSSVQFLDRLGRRGDREGDSAEILLQSFLQKALVGSSSMGRDVHTLMLSIQHFLCRPQRRPPS